MDQQDPQDTQEQVDYFHDEEYHLWLAHEKRKRDVVAGVFLGAAFIVVVYLVTHALRPLL